MINIPLTNELAKNAVHLGHRTSRVCPQMLPYISGVQATIHIIDLEKTRQKLEEALNFLTHLIQNQGVILFVGTKPSAKKIIKEAALKANVPYVNEKWIGGTLTNFPVILDKLISKLKTMRQEKKDNLWLELNKKEQIEKAREIERLEKMVGGIASLTKIPDALFVIDLIKEKTAIREAKRLNIPVIGLVDTNANPTLIDWPIPANDDARRSIQFITDLVVRAIKEAQNQPKNLKKEKEKNEKKEEKKSEK
ncbi:MAG: 30S ribosomal protein S2 [Parcubacteria group bacterium ADurb.Bin159]|nr:MAG: 30S ribosomal protein S2 [Parcubacteria group bacterium ADurb.Bin159]